MRNFNCSPASYLTVTLLLATVIASAQPGKRSAAGPVSVTATVETEPVPHPRDAADDPLIFIHPTDPALSAVMGNDKHGAYEVYDLAGKRVQSLPVDAANTDIRYNFPLAGEKVALVVGFSATKGGRDTIIYISASRCLKTARGSVIEPIHLTRSSGAAIACPRSPHAPR